MSELEKIINSSGRSMEELATLMGISDTKELNYKLNNIGELTTTDITQLIEILHIRDPIKIFCQISDKTSHGGW